MSKEFTLSLATLIFADAPSAYLMTLRVPVPARVAGSDLADLLSDTRDRPWAGPTTLAG